MLKVDLAELLIPTLVPLGICVVLPILVVWIVSKTRRNTINRKYELLQKAVEHGVELDPKLRIDEKEKNNTLKMQLLSKLQWGVIFLVAGISCLMLCVFAPVFTDGGILALAIVVTTLALGIGFMVSYFVGRRDLKKELALEEEKKEE